MLDLHVLKKNCNKSTILKIDFLKITVMNEFWRLFIWQTPGTFKVEKKIDFSPKGTFHICFIFLTHTYFDKSFLLKKLKTS